MSPCHRGARIVLGGLRKTDGFERGEVTNISKSMVFERCVTLSLNTVEVFKKHGFFRCLLFCEAVGA
jgi:hypothetical protein